MYVILSVVTLPLLDLCHNPIILISSTIRASVQREKSEIKKL